MDTLTASADYGVFGDVRQTSGSVGAFGFTSHGSDVAGARMNQSRCPWWQRLSRSWQRVTPALALLVGSRAVGRYMLLGVEVLLPLTIASIALLPLLGYDGVAVATALASAYVIGGGIVWLCRPLQSLESTRWAGLPLLGVGLLQAVSLLPLPCVHEWVVLVALEFALLIVAAVLLLLLSPRFD